MKFAIHTCILFLISFAAFAGDEKTLQNFCKRILQAVREEIGIAQIPPPEIMRPLFAQTSEEKEFGFFTIDPEGFAKFIKRETNSFEGLFAGALVRLSRHHQKGGEILSIDSLVTNSALIPYVIRCLQVIAGHYLYDWVKPPTDVTLSPDTQPAWLAHSIGSMTAEASLFLRRAREDHRLGYRDSLIEASLRNNRLVPGLEGKILDISMVELLPGELGHPEFGIEPHSRFFILTEGIARSLGYAHLHYEGVLIRWEQALVKELGFRLTRRGEEMKHRAENWEDPELPLTPLVGTAGDETGEPQWLKIDWQEKDTLSESWLFPSYARLTPKPEDTHPDSALGLGLDFYIDLNDPKFLPKKHKSE
jgi:hypothetical protein